MNKKAAIFAGGCFWCIEDAFLPGTPEADQVSANTPKILDIESGYTGGEEKYANYSNHKYHGHREAVRVTYDPQVTTYRQLVKYFFTKHDPTDVEGSFYDRGFSYSPAVYYETDEEKEAIEQVIAELEDKKIFDKPIVTAIEPRQPFYLAEEYHQNYSQKNPEHYNQYAAASGRKDFTKSIAEKVYSTKASPEL